MQRGDVTDFLDLVREGGPTAAIWQLADSAKLRAQPRLDHHGRHTFTDRSRGHDQLLMIVAGYKPHLWPYTLTRLERFLPTEGVDVCVVCPGTAPQELQDLAARQGWSFLATKKNALALAQNLAIAAHPSARYLHKLDEDVLIGEGYLERMLSGYRKVAADGRYRPGFASPLINVNGFSYRLFLEELGVADAYLERFGELTQAAMDNKAQADGDAALFLWEHTVPFDETARRFAERDFGYTAVPHRFSIGAILMERDLWEEIGGFVVIPHGGLGHEERVLCQECVERSRVPFVLHDVFAGHFSFGRQDAVMRPALAALANGMLPPPVGDATTAAR